ncbi:hypothetical protein P153DRAFT_371243 [Dothidotthia symphoricarpi CBS 119687]|uniref:Cora-domain-containing protein n=1 Tax=Dothidotthia symphoricarpi CBS 119687 TaxID=1392245 RepID=A0A6A5ZY28_9PLEO|nr:uncharacterized protein P153DRAFT_371243 [Dothidotthia symphoricarpi CBS 119687]KAF2123925.1 hypothetical protein P153DRAFT_371243 [Dothidotthia symphoricarpi CBS 119687]
MDSSSDSSWMNACHNGILIEQPCTHRYIEISETKSGLSVIQEIKRDEDIPALCQSDPSTPDTVWMLRFLVTLTSRPSNWAIPYSRASYSALQKHWHMPNVCFSFLQVNSNPMPYSPILGDPSWEGIHLSSNSPRCFDLWLSRNPTTRTMFSILASNDPFTLDSIVQELLAAKSFAFQPYLLPFIVTGNKLQGLAGHFNRLSKDFQSISHILGSDEYFVPMLDQTEGPNMTDMPRKLTAMATALGGIVITLEAFQDTIDFVEDQLEKHSRLGPMDVVAEMRHRLGVIRFKHGDMRKRSEAMKDTVQVQVQMVYAVLQQKDNELSLRYGADMRIISAVTLIFLPGTFIATLFSTSFWNFDPQGTGPHVSKWVWLYFVSTVVLTVAVLGVWRGFTALRLLKKRVLSTWNNNVLLKKLRRVKDPVDEETGKKGA